MVSVVMGGWGDTYTCLVAHSQKGEVASRPFAQQRVQLFSGEAVSDQTEEEEGGEDDAQSPTQKRVQTHALVVRHIGSAWKQMECWGAPIYFLFSLHELPSSQS